MSRSAVVAAHPDDEILWMSSAMAQAEAVILCFGAPYNKPETAANRARAVAALNLPNLINLAIPESGVRQMVDWQAPLLTSTGMAISDPEGQARYDANFAALLERLRPELVGIEAVFTHNPWGEYGHPEHIQLYRALCVLQAELGFTIWFSGYAAPLSLGLARVLGAAPLWAEKTTAPPDARLARRLRGVYLRHHVWTWSLFHRWPALETFYSQPPGPRDSWHSLQGETLLDATKLRWWKPDSAARISI